MSRHRWLSLLLVIALAPIAWLLWRWAVNEAVAAPAPAPAAAISSSSATACDTAAFRTELVDLLGEGMNGVDWAWTQAPDPRKALEQLHRTWVRKANAEAGRILACGVLP